VDSLNASLANPRISEIEAAALRRQVAAADMAGRLVRGASGSGGVAAAAAVAGAHPRLTLTRSAVELDTAPRPSSAAQSLARPGSSASSSTGASAVAGWDDEVIDLLNVDDE